MGSVSCENLIIRADASVRVGTGHMMRCLALAQAWRDRGGRAVFLSHCESNTLRQRVEAMGIDFVPLNRPYPESTDLEELLALSRQFSASWIVLDGYHFAPTYQQSVRAAGYRLLVIDDVAHWSEYHVDILLNQNINARQLRYLCDPDTELLLGTQYALLRPEFLVWRGWRREVPETAHKVLVTLGGSDPDNATLKVLRALQLISVTGVESRIVVGPANPNLETLQRAIQGSADSLQLLTDVNNMPELMAWADVAIVAGGSTCWELAFMGAPAVLLVLANNQTAVAAGLNSAGAALNLGWHASLKATDIAGPLGDLLRSPDKRRAMTRHGKRLVDGNGAMRVASLLNRGGLVLRLVQREDCRLIWEWASDPVTRAHSFSPEPIPWEQHLLWFEARLIDPSTYFYVAMDVNTQPIGQLRFQVEGDAATVSVSLAPGQRGKGYGAEIIRLGFRQMFAATVVKLIHAYIKPGNDASIRAFGKAGFASTGTVEVQGCSALHFVLRRPQDHAGSISD